MAIISEAGQMEIFKKIFSFAKNTVSATKNDYKQEKAKNRSNSLNALDRSSIMRASKDLVMTFPVLCTDTIQISTASMIAKAIERNCVTTLQLIFASANLSGNNGLEVLSKWHKNFDNDMDIDEYIDAVDALAITAQNAWSRKDTYAAEINDIKNMMVKECAENNQYFPESSFSESSISNYVLESSIYNNELSVIKEYDGSLSDLDKDPDYVIDDMEDLLKHKNQFSADNANRQTRLDREKFDFEKQQRIAQNAREDQRARDLKNQNDIRNAFTQQQLDMQSKYQKQQMDIQNRQLNMQQKQNDISNQLARDNYNRQLDKDKYDMRMKDLSSKRELFQKQLLDSDIKKCNELVPSLMIVNYLTTDPTGNSNTMIEQEFVAGVKARLISCSSYEIIDRIKSIQKNKPNMLNLVRATTKEISFCKDFVAGIEQAKIDVKRNSKLSKNSAIWRSLQARSTRSGLNRLKRNRANDAGAITTLVISDEEVNYMKKVEGIDLNIPGTAKSIMEAYNLMGLVIVDEQVEVAKFLFDGEKYFQEFAFNTLERETGDNSYKKVVNLLSRNIK